ncbi:Exonuclease 3'-5' domain-containing protein 2 [Chytriomyces hyalinus]|nr:Exonuclease 3'-5' domain-containing protein 2 [Chytriomyces hyalinus]
MLRLSVKHTSITPLVGIQLLLKRHVSQRSVKEPVPNHAHLQRSKTTPPTVQQPLTKPETLAHKSKKTRSDKLNPIGSVQQPKPSHQPSITDIIPTDVVKPAKKRQRRSKSTPLEPPSDPAAPTSTISLSGVSIHICDSLATLPRLLNICGSGPLVSVDLEWNVVLRRGQPAAKTSLIQICNGSSVGLFRVKMLTDGFRKPLPKVLSDYLENAQIKKVGMNIRGDAAKLNRDFGISLGGYIELSQLAKEVCPELFDKERVSLKKLSERLLNHKLDKSDSLRKTNWEATVLRDELIHYAAMDALVGFEVYKALLKKRWSPKTENYEKKLK